MSSAFVWSEKGYMILDLTECTVQLKKSSGDSWMAYVDQHGISLHSGTKESCLKYMKALGDHLKAFRFEEST